MTLPLSLPAAWRRRAGRLPSGGRAALGAAVALAFLAAAGIVVLMLADRPARAREPAPSGGSPTAAAVPRVSAPQTAGAPAVRASVPALAAATAVSASAPPPSAVAVVLPAPTVAARAAAAGVGAAIPPATNAAAAVAAGPAGVTALGCLIEASAVAEVGTPVVGVIETVAVERGDLVRRGQVLAQHENRVERAAVVLAEQKVANSAELRAAKSQIGYARKKVERTATLTELNYVSSQALDQAQTESTLASMRLAQAVEQQELAHKELELARAQLAQRTVTSPLDGVVVDRLVAPGERVENRPIFKIAQIDPLRVEVVLPASAFGTVQPGATVRVSPELPGVTPRVARVAIVDRVVDAASNTFRARLSLPNPAPQLPSGLRCRVEFQ